MSERAGASTRSGAVPRTRGHVRRRVALIHFTAPPVVGGVERVIGQHAVLMSEAGHAVTIVAGRGAAPDPRVRFLAVPLVDTLDPRIRRLRRSLDRAIVPDEFGALVTVLADSLRPVLADQDVVLAHNVCSLHLNLVLTAALHSLVLEGMRARFVAWHHDLAWTQPRFRDALHDGHPWDLLRSAWPRVEHVTVSAMRRAELAGLLGIPSADIRVVRNGLDVGRELALVPATLRLIDRLAVLEADPVLLTPARLLPRKNIELALEVVASLRRLGRPAALLVTGPADPHDRAGGDYVRSLVARRAALGLVGAAWFLALEGGAPSDRVVSDLYRLADALFLPSRDEGFGLPVLEAALHRLPIVATDLPALREVVGEAATWLDPDGDPDVLAHAVIARLETDPEASLWRRVRREYSWSAVYRDGIAPLLAGGRGPR